MYGKIAIGVALPFVGTALGAATVFLLKNQLNDKIRKFLLGFASGVMIAASIWSLIIPASEMAIMWSTANCLLRCTPSPEKTSIRRSW